MSRFQGLRARLHAILGRLGKDEKEVALRAWMHHGEAPRVPALLRFVLAWEEFILEARANTYGIDLEAGVCLRGLRGYVRTDAEQQDARRLAARWALVQRAKAGDGTALAELAIAHREAGEAARRRREAEEAEDGGP